jgi:hypothetical protein
MNLLHKKRTYETVYDTETRFKYINKIEYSNPQLNAGILFLKSAAVDKALARPKPCDELRLGDLRGHWQRSTNPKVTLLIIATVGKTTSNRNKAL